MSIKPIIGNSSKIKRLEQFVDKVAKQATTVLILGESGSGKELVAQRLHEVSGRLGAFVAVNCAAIPLELLESELFGHEKGAFTGAVQARQGRFELAKGGTLFLDEIGDMPASMQAKLLRVLQERVFERVGGNKAIETDVRIVAATHQDLAKCVQVGKFRQDLYYRLNVFPIEVPPLRERKEDIALLTQHFLKALESHSTFSQEAMDVLTHYDWPGNVRELVNLVERFAILYPNHAITDEEVNTQLVAKKPQKLSVSEDFDLREYLSGIELDLISQALEKDSWVITKAAKRLGLRRTTLVEKIKKYGIDRGMLSQG